MSKKLLVPRKGVKVRDPQTGAHIPEEGAVRMVNTYFNRRISDGDLEIREIPRALEKKKASKVKKQDGDE